MDRFFVDKNNINLENNTCVIVGEDVKHISKVLRCKIGEKLEICDKDNSEYICEITDINKEQVDLDIIEKREIQADAFLDEKGNVTHSPEKVNSVFPLGNDPKGYALCLAIELLTGIFANTKIGKQIEDQYDLGYLWIAIDPKMFGALEDFENKVVTICKEIKNSQKNEKEIYLPGEQSSIIKQKAIQKGIVKIDEETYERLKNMSCSLEGGLTYINDLID